MLDFLDAKLQVFEAELQEAKTIHAREVVAKAETEAAEAPNVEARQQELEAAHKTLDSRFTAFNQGVVADIRQLTGQTGQTGAPAGAGAPVSAA